MKTILLVFGTRPEAIKLAPIVREIEKFPEQLKLKICVTAQHRQMLDQVLELFQIKPDYDLDLMTARQSLEQIVSSVLLGLEPILSELRPDITLVQGDTASTMAASLASYFHKIPVGHVEAGLRTGQIYSPWPEEINRKVTAVIAQWHFAPTECARQNLRREGVDDQGILVTGNTVIDALYQTIATIDVNRELRMRLEAQFAFLEAGKRIVLVTGHRRESFGKGMEDICAALREIALSFPEIDLVYPMHLNPNVREPVNRVLGGLGNVHLIEPLEYAPFVYLMKRSNLIVTDSGGVQEEAPSLNKPVLVTREVTERPEAVEAGAVRIVGADRARIISEVSRLLSDPVAYKRMTGIPNPYGDGQAAQRIVECLLRD